MPAYFIANASVTDPVRYEDYKRLASVAVAAYGGRYCVRGGAIEWLEGDWKPDRSIKLKADSKKIGLKKESDVHLWVVPTNVDGVWCGSGNATGTRMLLDQQFQRATGTVSNARGVHHFQAAIKAQHMRSTAGDGRIDFEDVNDVLHVRGAEGVFAHLKGSLFSRSCCGSCEY